MIPSLLDQIAAAVRDGTNIEAVYRERARGARQSAGRWKSQEWRAVMDQRWEASLLRIVLEAMPPDAKWISVGELHERLAVDFGSQKVRRMLYRLVRRGNLERTGCGTDAMYRVKR